MNNEAIALFDSGIGGTTTLNALREKMPKENFIYIADHSNLPYGNKTKRQIIESSSAIFRWIKTKRVKLIVVACNTSNTNAIAEIRQLVNTRVFGISEAIQDTIQNKINNEDQIFILATPATVYSNFFNTYNNKTLIKTIPCPGLASLIEEVSLDCAENAVKFHTYLNEYMATVRTKRIKNLIYGCTHYPLIHNTIAEFFTNSNIIDPSLHLAESVYHYLESHNISNKETNEYGNVSYYTTGSPIVFAKKLQEINTIYPLIKHSEINYIDLKYIIT